MAIIGSAYVEIRALDTNLQRDIDKAMKKVKDPLITLQSNVNLKPVRDKISLLREELRRNPLKFSAEVDLGRVNESFEKVRREQSDRALNIEVDANTIRAEESISRVRAEYSQIHSDVVAEAHTRVAESELDFLSRNRTSKISASIDPSTTKALKGLFYTLTGALPADKIKDVVTGLAGNLEMASISAAKLLTVLGSVGAAGLTLGADLFTLGGDLSNILNLVAIGPAAMSTMAVGIVGMTIAWKGFGKAFSSNAKTAAKALEKLPIEAQNAVKALKGVWTQITKPAQKAFWVEMGTALQDTVQTMLPALKKGLTGTDVALAKMTKGALASFKELAKSGGLDILFKNINQTLTNTSKGVKPFFDAINTLSVSGSKHMVTFGNYLATSAEKFNKFIEKAGKAGDIDRWITSAVTNIKDLGRAVGGTADLFKGLTHASDASGGEGLSEFATGMQNIATTVNGAAFQTKLVTVLKGARRGAEALGEGFGKITKLVGDSTVAISGFLTVAGQVGGALLGGFATIFDGTGVGEGIIIGLTGAKNAITDMDPAFRSLGGILGDLGEISGTLFEQMAPGVNNLLTTVEGVVAGLKDGVIAAMPIFNEFVQNFLQVAAPLVIGFAQAIGNLLKGFSELPGPIQNIIMILGGLLLLKAKFGGFFDGLGKSAEKTLSKVKDRFAQWTYSPAAYALSNSFKDTRTAANNLSTGVGDSLRKMRGAFSETGSSISKGFKDSFSQVGSYYKSNVQDKMKSFRDGFKSAFEVPHEVHDGFKRVGANIENTFRDTAGRVLNTVDSIGAGVKAESKNLGAAFKEFPVEVKSIFDDAKMAVGDAADGMGEKVRDRSIYASKHLENAGKGIKTAVNDIRTGSAAMGDHLRAMVSPAESAIAKGTQSVARSYNSMVLAGTIAGTTLASKLQPVSDTVKSVASGVQSSATSIGTSIAGAATSVARSTADLGTRMAAPIREGVADVRRSVTGVGTAFTGLGRFAASAATGASSALSGAAQGISRNFAPVGPSIRAAFSAVGDSARTAAGHVGSLAGATGRAAGAVGRSAGQGLKGAAAGLSGMLGGPWGIALAGAGIAVSIFAEAQANAKAKVDGLAASLDQQTGAMTGASKKLVAKDWLDVDASGWDDLWRSGRRNMEEIVRDTGINSEAITKTLSDPSGRDAFVANFKSITAAVRAGQGVTDDLAASVHMTKEQLKGLSTADLLEMSSQFEGAAKTAAEAEAQVSAVAKATGTSNVQAAILAKNFDILGASTSSASDKFAALKENLDLLNTSKTKPDTAQKGYQQSLRDTTAAIEEVKKSNKGLVNNLLTVDNGFNFTTQAGSNLHTALSGQKDAILELGTAAMQKAFDGGKDLKGAQDAAMAAIQPAITSFRASLKALDFTPAQIDGIITSLNLVPKNITTALKVEGTEQARIDIFNTAMAAQAFKDGNYAATLAALPDAAKKEIERVTDMAGAFADGKYDGILEALDKTEGGRQKALLGIMSVVNGHYEGLILAKDGTKLGTDSAKGQIRSVTGITVPIKVVDQVTVPVGVMQRVISNMRGVSPVVSITDDVSGRVGTLQGIINGLTGKTVSIGYVQGNGPRANNGGIVRNMANMFSGSFPLAKVKAFAHGGVEKHVAQISRGQTPFRVWSEPETGGEAYIPLSKAKRGRSVKILEEVAKMFGMSLIKVKAFANGGVDGGSKGSSSASSSLSTTKVSAALVSTIARELLKDNRSLNNIGENIVDGIIGGVNRQSGKAVTSMTGLAGSLEEAVRTRLEIHSPSKTFLGLGKHIVDGLTIGIKDGVGTAHKHMSTLANQLYVAASDVAKATGRSVSASINIINHQRALNAAWKRMPPAKYSDQIVDYYQKTGRLGNSTLNDIVRAREDVNFRLNMSNSRLKSLQTARADIFKSVASQIRGEYKLGTSIVGDTQPYIPQMRFSDVKNYTTGVASRLKAFNSKISALKKKGVAPALINEIAMLGSIEGSSVADAVLSGSSAEVKGLNSDYANIAVLSNTVGSTTADAMYKVGIDAQAGLVRGLQRDSASLTSAANKMTSLLVAQIKKNLGIRSPSRVFAEMGRFASQGFIMGLDQMQSSLDKRVDSFINLDPRQASVGTSSSLPRNAVTTQPAKEVTVIVNPSAGMDEVAVGKAAVRELNWQLLSQ